MTEREYARAFHQIRQDVENTTAAYYTVDEINQFARDDHANLDKLNRDPNFWKLTRFSLETTYFITLGRIFDRGTDVHSINYLLDLTENHPEFFLKSALAKRKQETQGSLDTDPAWEPTTDELKSFRIALEPALAKYREKYNAIRHKLFAHTEKKEGVVTKLLENTMYADIESILCHLNEVVFSLNALYENGAKHEVGAGTRALIEMVRDSARTA